MRHYGPQFYLPPTSHGIFHNIVASGAVWPQSSARRKSKAVCIAFDSHICELQTSLSGVVGCFPDFDFEIFG